MASITINIYPDCAKPETATISPGDTVTFALMDRTDAVTVTFSNNSSPFSTLTVSIPGGTTLLSSPKSVRSDVTPSTTYHYTAPKLSDPEPQPDPPGTLSGGLDVSTDHPPEKLGRPSSSSKT